MGRMLRLLRSIIFPVKCPYCGEPIDYRDAACEKCKEKNFSEVYEREIEICDGKTSKNVSAALYDGSVRDAILKYKFHGKKDFSYQFAVAMEEALSSLKDKEEYDIITSVPLSKMRLKTRGYNQAAELAKVLSTKAGIPYKETLEKIKENKVQHDLPGSERAENVRGVYRITDEKEVKGKKILICDDIITTGSTLAECIKELLNGGVNRVDAITLSDARLK